MTAVVIALFDDEGPYLRARTRAITADRRIVGEWLPYASDALGKGPGERGIVGWTVLGGFIGGAALFALETWSSVLAYPFDSGGRPLWSWPTLVQAPVEFSALAGAIAGIIVMFARARLTRLHDAAFDFDEVAHASRDAFVLALGCDEDDARATIALLADAGATQTRLIRP